MVKYVWIDLSQLPPPHCEVTLRERSAKSCQQRSTARLKVALIFNVAAHCTRNAANIKTYIVNVTSTFQESYFPWLQKDMVISVTSKIHNNMVITYLVNIFNWGYSCSMRGVCQAHANVSFSRLVCFANKNINFKLLSAQVLNIHYLSFNFQVFFRIFWWHADSALLKVRCAAEKKKRRVRKGSGTISFPSLYPTYRAGREYHIGIIRNICLAGAVARHDNVRVFWTRAR